MISIKEELAKNLQYYRKKQKITQKQLSEKLGVKPNTISSWESGANSIDVEILFNVCKILDVSINEMYGQFVVNPHSETLTSEETELIKKYRTLDGSGKKSVNVLINGLYSDDEKIEAKKYKEKNLQTDAGG